MPNYSRGAPWSSDEDDYLCELRSNQVPFAMIAGRITARFGKDRTEDACIGRWNLIEHEDERAIARVQAALEIRERNRRERVDVPARFYVPETPWPEPRKASQEPAKLQAAARSRKFREKQKVAACPAMDPKPAPMVMPTLKSRHYTTSWT